jgi:hypothetical protein
MIIYRIDIIFRFDAFEDVSNSVCDLVGKSWRDSIAYLVELLSSRPFKSVVIRESLHSGRLPDGQASVLTRIRMNEVVSVFGDVGGNSRGGSLPALDAEPIGELLVSLRIGDVPVLRLKELGEIL